jgi:hypothetical protein
VTFAANLPPTATKPGQRSIAARQVWALLLVIETPHGDIPMSNPNQTITIAALGLFSVLSLLNVASQIV